MKSKKTQTLLKKKLHPLVSYAFLLGIGTIAIASASPLAAPDEYITPALVPSKTAIASVPAKPGPSQDLASLKTSAAQFADQLSIIKSQIAELESYGRTAPSELLDAIGQGEQLTGVIAQANTFSDIGEADPAEKLRTIGAIIAENSKF